MLRNDLSKYNKQDYEIYVEDTLWAYISMLCGLCAGMGVFISVANKTISVMIGVATFAFVWKFVADKPFTHGIN